MAIAARLGSKLPMEYRSVHKFILMYMYKHLLPVQLHKLNISIKTTNHALHLDYHFQQHVNHFILKSVPDRFRFILYDKYSIGFRNVWNAKIIASQSWTAVLLGHISGTTLWAYIPSRHLFQCSRQITSNSFSDFPNTTLPQKPCVIAQTYSEGVAVYTEAKRALL
jgi:hypothetical protein